MQAVFPAVLYEDDVLALLPEADKERFVDPYSQFLLFRQIVPQVCAHCHCPSVVGIEWPRLFSKRVLSVYLGFHCNQSILGFASNSLQLFHRDESTFAL